MNSHRHTSRSAASILLALALLLLPSIAAEAQHRRKSRRKPAPRSQPEFIAKSLDDPREGKVVGQTYSNKFFGLTLNFPDGWFVLSEAGNEALRERAKTKIKPDDQQRKEALEQALERTYNLLTVGQYLVAPPGQSSATLACVAEILTVENLKPAQYVELLKHSLTAMNIKYEIVGDQTQEQIAGEEFARLKLTADSPAGAVTQEYHVTLRRGFALTFVLTYQTDEQHALLSDALNSVRLDKGVAPRHTTNWDELLLLRSSSG